MMLGLGAGFSPAPRTDKPEYVYTGRMEPTGLVRTGDAADKLEYTGGREFFAVLSDPLPVAVVAPAAPVKTAPAVVVAAQPAPAAPPPHTQPVVDDKNLLGLDQTTTLYLVGAAGLAAVLFMRGRK